MSFQGWIMMVKKVKVAPKKYKRTANAISVYLSPRASRVLDKYHKNSGFGSLSRTVEEMILAYDKIYTTILSSIASSGGFSKFFSTPGVILLTFLFVINNFNLTDGSPFEQTLKNDMKKTMQKPSEDISVEM